MTARRRLGDIRGGIAAPSPSNGNVRLLPKRTIGDEPRRLVDICRPATPPNILLNRPNKHENRKNRKNTKLINIIIMFYQNRFLD